MNNLLSGLSVIFPCNDIEKTSNFYEKKLKFKSVKYLNVQEPHICLYRDSVEIILTQVREGEFVPNHIRYGYGYDAYLYTKKQEELEKEFLDEGVNIVKAIGITDYKNKEFVIEDYDGRYIAFGSK